MFSLEWVAEKLNSQGTGGLAGEVTSVCTDTRTLEPGALFFALVGEQSDGHEYVRQAFAKGAVGAIVSREISDVVGAQIVVPDTLLALGDLAKHYRQKFSLPVIGITGSVGKTSTKEMLAAILRTRYNTLASAKNFNNEIGVPQTLFQLTPAHQVAIIEMGMRGPGQIDRLAEIACPTMGVITNTGFAHIELLGSREKIAKAKAELFARLITGSIAILPLHSPFADLLKKAAQHSHIVTFSPVEGQDATVQYLGVVENAAGKTGTAHRIRVDGDEILLQLKAVGTHHIANSLPAIAVGWELDIPLPEIVAALEEWEGAEGRMTLRQARHGVTVLDDCYNAGPESMASALQTLASLIPAEDRAKTTSGQAGVAILGDMRELGDFAPEAHRYVARQLCLHNFRTLITVGELATIIADETARIAETEALFPPEARHHFATTAEATAQIPAQITPGEKVLVKGSRAMQMEQIVTALTGEKGSDTHG